VFVQHRGRRGAPIGGSLAQDAVRRAVARAGVAAPWGGANLLRHSLATALLAHGSSLVEIADLLGHRSLQNTMIYATVDRDALRRCALPWPGRPS
jgi:site-specific recombinase XerD